MEYKELFSKYKYYIIIAILSVISAILYVYISSDKSLDTNIPESVLDDEVVIKDIDTIKEECSVFVDVSGAVTKPAVYCLPKDSLVIDAIKKAGGFNNKLYSDVFVRNNVNLAKKLVENEKIYIPYKEDMKCVSLDLVRIEKKEVMGVGDQNIKNDCISLNSASLSQLDTLNGVGPSVAQKIIDARPYKSIDDLQNVSGIGEVLFEKIKDSICL